ncbi:MFS transporter [Streptomyces boluensis]|uniref:MFS transporter n=1 Tax=Streptomyces boluensis TaxID=1775135 RepID=UPI001FEC0EED|nr:MFS transporter [Streptomyces boluensis]
MSQEQPETGPEKGPGLKPARGASQTYREVIGLSGALLPVISFLGRLPTAIIQMGSVLMVTRTSGSLATGGAVACALALGQVSMGPFVGRLADRRGQRPVVLVLAALNALAITVFTAGALLDAATPLLVLLGALAGATVPGIGPLARARLVALARRRSGDGRLVDAVMSLESTMDEVSFVLGPAAVGLAAVVGHPAYAMIFAALLVAVCGTGFALHPTASTLPPTGGHPQRPRARAAEEPARARGARSRMPRQVYVVRIGLVLLGVLLGGCGAGITALTEDLGRPDQAGLVYAAMGVMSAVVGLSMAALPERFGLLLRWRVATAAAVLLSLPLVWTDSLAGLYVVVTVFGAIFAPNLITGFGLTERAVPRERLAEGMTFASSAFVGGQAVTLAVAGQLAESYGPAAAFAVGSAAAALAFVVALATRPIHGAGPGTEELASDTKGDEQADAQTRSRGSTSGSTRHPGQGPGADTGAPAGLSAGST